MISPGFWINRRIEWLVTDFPDQLSDNGNLAPVQIESDPRRLADAVESLEAHAESSTWTMLEPLSLIITRIYETVPLKGTAGNHFVEKRVRCITHRLRRGEHRTVETMNITGKSPRVMAATDVMQSCSITPSSRWWAPGQEARACRQVIPVRLDSARQ
jgi:hypothetical protein